MLEETTFSNDTFEAITMHHVMEHLFDPIRTLQECRRVLKPKGEIVIITPNIESLGSRLFGRACFSLEPPRHLYLFSPYTLRICTEKAGLRILELRTIPRLADWIWVTSRLIQKNGILPGGIPNVQSHWLCLQGLVFGAIEWALCFVKDVGEELVLIAKK